MTKTGMFLYFASGWLAIGFLVGSLATVAERDSRTYDAKSRTFKDSSLSGCVYKSAAPLINPGYIAGCELFRRRFSHEGIEKVFGE